MLIFSVYNRKTDMPVYIHGTVKECAAAMGVKESSFHSIYSAQRSGRRLSNTWEIILDEGDDEDADL